ncbi:MAG: SoxY-related AACIE arm protein [Rhabdaerophilum sp.]
MSRRFSPPFATEATRRTVLAGAAAVFGLVSTRRVAAEPEDMARTILDFTGGIEPRSGKVTLDIAPLVENGNAVSFEVLVDHPMKPEDHVREIALFTDKNPLPDVAVFRLTPHMGKAHVVSRMRLATTQHVTAVARLSDGSFWAERREVIVTIAACTEE